MEKIYVLIDNWVDETFASYDETYNDSCVIGVFDDPEKGKEAMTQAFELCKKKYDGVYDVEEIDSAICFKAYADIMKLSEELVLKEFDLNKIVDEFRSC